MPEGDRVSRRKACAGACVALLAVGAGLARAQSDQPWIEATSQQYTVHYVTEYRRDVAFVRRWLNATERLMREKYGLARHGYEVDVYLEPAPTSRAGVGLATIISGSDRAEIHYMTPSAPAWKEARRQGATTGLGRPFDNHYHAKTLVHEYVSLAHTRLTVEKPEGFHYYSAPSWFYQGLEEHDGMFHSTPGNRTAGFRALLEHADTRLRERFHCCRTLARQPAFASGDPYFGGALLLRFLADTYGEGVHAAILRRPEATFNRALARELGSRGSSVSQAFTAFREWFERQLVEEP